MIKDITIGQYYPGESPIHQLDPRMKISLAMGFMIVIFFAGSYAAYAVAAAYILLAAAVARIPWKFLLRSLKPLMFLIAITFIFNIFLTPGQTVLLEWGVLRITLEGIDQAIKLALRLVFLVMGTSLLTLTTSPVQLTDGLESLMKPLTIVRFPAHELAMMMTIALRFIPTLLEETDRIMKAQTARGADFESGRLMQRAKAMVPLLVPLFISAFRRADELAMAMEARCYRGGGHRTRMRELHLQKRDALALAITAVMAVLLIVL